jgi:CelD/BcsL family acetyltransferase involved in cellulose biosynthesis
VFELHRGEEAFTRMENAWDSLSSRTPTPFVTHAWHRAWWRSYGAGEPVVAAVHADDGRLRAAALLREAPFGGLAAAANDHCGDWGAVAEDDAARRELWDGLAGAGFRHLGLLHLRDAAAGPALSARGFRLLVVPGNRSPYLELPGDFDALLASLSRNARSQFRRRRRQLEEAGAVTLRTRTAGGDGLDADLDELFRVEGSGWKAREGTAILTEPGSEPLYRSFAHAAAEKGWLRLYLLEVDGRVIAGDLGCAIGGEGFLVKTGFDESWQERSPGLVLRGEVLRASIEEGLTGYDFLGPSDEYKLRWTENVRPRVTVRGFRGAALPGIAWHARLRPWLKRARAAAASARRSRDG